MLSPLPPAGPKCPGRFPLPHGPVPLNPKAPRPFDELEPKPCKPVPKPCFGGPKDGIKCLPPKPDTYTPEHGPLIDILDERFRQPATVRFA